MSYELRVKSWETEGKDGIWDKKLKLAIYECNGISSSVAGWCGHLHWQAEERNNSVKQVVTVLCFSAWDSFFVGALFFDTQNRALPLLTE